MLAPDELALLEDDRRRVRNICAFLSVVGTPRVRGTARSVVGAATFS